MKWDSEYIGAGQLPSTKKKVHSSHAQYFSNILTSYELQGSILDIGCGNGKDANAFKKFQVVGVDISHHALKLAAKHEKVVQADLRKPWPFADGSFAAALDGTTFINMVSESDVTNYFAQLCRCVRVDGRIMFVSPVLPDGYYASLSEHNGLVTNGHEIVQRVYTKDAFLGTIDKHLVREEFSVFKKKNKMFGQEYDRVILRGIWRNSHA
jgi:SAM-dependent methyltransferase